GSGSRASTPPPACTGCRTTSSSTGARRPESSSTARCSPTSRSATRRPSAPSPRRRRPRSKPELITSRDNERLKLVRKLRDRRWRDKLGLFVVEGEDLVEAASGLEPVELLVAGEDVEPALLAEVSDRARAAPWRTARRRRPERRRRLRPRCGAGRAARGGARPQRRDGDDPARDRCRVAERGDGRGDRAVRTGTPLAVRTAVPVGHG